MPSYFIMKRGILLVLTLLFLPLFVSAAPPSFHIFSGYVSCDDGDFVDGESLTLIVFNSSNNFTQSVSISSGVYSVLVDADTTYTVNFTADGTYLDQYPYQAYGFSEEVNFTLASDHSFCEEDAPPPNNNNNNNNDECGNDDVESGEDCDGDDLDGETCITLGYASGTLGCNDDCEFDVSDCLNGTGTYCGDGTCNSGENCDTCPEDCEPCGNEWELSGPDVGLNDSELEEVVSIGGDYVLISPDGNYDFSVYNVGTDSVMVDINGQTYTISYQSTQELVVGDYEFEISYLETNEGKAKLSFKKIGLRGVTSYQDQAGEILYYIIGVVVLGGLIFFFVRWITKRSSVGNIMKPLRKESKLISKSKNNLDQKLIKTKDKSPKPKLKKSVPKTRKKSKKSNLLAGPEE